MRLAHLHEDTGSYTPAQILAGDYPRHRVLDALLACGASLGGLLNVEGVLPWDGIKYIDIERGKVCVYGKRGGSRIIVDSQAGKPYKITQITGCIVSVPGTAKQAVDLIWSVMGR